MNLKFLLLFMLSLNILTLGFAVNAPSVVFYDDVFLSTFLNIDNPANAVNESAQFDLSENFNSSVQSLTREESGAAAGSFVPTFLDVVKIIIDFVGVILGVPFIGMFWSLGIPVYFKYLIVVPMMVMYYLSVAEFIRGASA